MKYERIFRENQRTTVALEVLNTEKDTFYDVNAIRFIDLLPGFKMVDMEHLNIREEEIQEANLLFNQVFDFYGGYAQMSADAKD